MTESWAQKKEFVRAAVQLAMRDFLAGRPEAKCVFWADEATNAADPRVILTSVTQFEEIVARVGTFDESTKTYANGESTLMQFDLDVRVESVAVSGERTADNVAAKLRLRFREDAFRAALLEGNVKTVGTIGPIRYVGRAGEERKVSMFQFSVPMRTEMFEADPTGTTGIVESTTVHGTLKTNPGVEPAVNVAVEIATAEE